MTTPVRPFNQVWVRCAPANGDDDGEVANQHDKDGEQPGQREEIEEV